MKTELLADTNCWTDIAAKCDYATFFHTPLWYKVFEKQNSGSAIATRKLVFKDGKTAILPLMEEHGTFFRKKYISGPAGVYGGWISNEALSEKQIQELYHYIETNIKDIVFRVNPFQGEFARPGFGDILQDFTQVLDLRAGFKKIVKGWTKGHYSAAMQAKRSGVTIREAESEEDWLGYFNCYEDSLRRWGTEASSRYEWEFFKSLFLLHSPEIKLWLAELNNRIISGSLCFYHNRHVVYWHGASLEDSFEVRPVHGLQYHIISDATEKGYFWYDFNPSGGHEGVVQFKKFFGTERKECPIVKLRSFKNHVLDSIAFRWNRYFKSKPNPTP